MRIYIGGERWNGVGCGIDGRVSHVVFKNGMETKRENLYVMNGAWQCNFLHGSCLSDDPQKWAFTVIQEGWRCEKPPTAVSPAARVRTAASSSGASGGVRCDGKRTRYTSALTFRTASHFPASRSLPVAHEMRTVL